MKVARGEVITGGHILQSGERELEDGGYLSASKNGEELEWPRVPILWPLVCMALGVQHTHVQGPFRAFFLPVQSLVVTSAMPSCAMTRRRSKQTKVQTGKFLVQAMQALQVENEGVHYITAMG